MRFKIAFFLLSALFYCTSYIATIDVHEVAQDDCVFCFVGSIILSDNISLHDYFFKLHAEQLLCHEEMLEAMEQNYWHDYLLTVIFLTGPPVLAV